MSKERPRREFVKRYDHHNSHQHRDPVPDHAHDVGTPDDKAWEINDRLRHGQPIPADPPDFLFTENGRAYLIHVH